MGKTAKTPSPSAILNKKRNMLQKIKAEERSVAKERKVLDKKLQNFKAIKLSLPTIPTMRSIKEEEADEMEKQIQSLEKNFNKLLKK
jgi:septal ring factor EnvC (AmiA/AmiB activator)